MAQAQNLSGEKAGCIICVSHSRVTIEALEPQPEGPWSASGIILTANPGIVLCHGAIFTPFLLGSKCQDWSQCRVLPADSFSADIQIQVLQPSERSSRIKKRGWLDLEDSIPALRINPLSNQHEAPSSLKHHKAELIMMVPCRQFREAFSKVFSASDQWHLGENEVVPESSLLEDDLRFLHWFAVLKILDCNFHGTGGVSCVPAKSLRKGDSVFTCGSPFGSFCPDIFMNTLSKGIVSNMVGEGNALILTDARCLPGTEGGGVFVQSGNGLHLVGIIVAPFCWKSNEWIGLTLVCAIDHIIESIRNILSGPHRFLKPWLDPMCLVAKVHGNMEAKSGLDQQMLAAVGLVECGPTWGSGVMVTSRLMLTCQHVVNGASSVSLRFQCSPEKTSVAKGKVVFATADASPYDVALVELEESFSPFAEPALASTFCEGEDVHVVSFGVFGQACGPSINSGILSAVITVEDKPVMLQTTCAVHSGSSGGALFATSSGKLLGIVASNTRDSRVGATYPHLNFSIPITVLQAAILEYSHTRSLCGFQELDRVGSKVKFVWRLQREPVEVPHSKL